MLHIHVEVLFGIAHLEEVLVLSASERVVSIGTLAFSILLRLLDIPEDMVRNGLEDTLLAGGLQTVLVGILEILDEVVFLTLLEDSELLVEDGVELVDVELGPARLELVQDANTPSILVLNIDVPDLSLGRQPLVECLHVLWIIKFLVSELLVGHSIHEGAVFVSWSTSEWVDNLLHQAAFLVLRDSVAGQGLLLGAACVVGGNALLVLVEVLVLLLVVGEVLLGHRLVVSDVDALKLFLLLVVVAAVDVVADFSGVGLLLSL